MSGRDVGPRKAVSGAEREVSLKRGKTFQGTTGCECTIGATIDSTVRLQVVPGASKPGESEAGRGADREGRRIQGATGSAAEEHADPNTSGWYAGLSLLWLTLHLTNPNCTLHDTRIAQISTPNSHLSDLPTFSIRWFQSAFGWFP